MGATAYAQDTDAPRGYLQLRFGESNPATRTHDAGGGSIGANLGRHLGAELSLDGYELFLDDASGTKVAELGLLAIGPVARARYPLLNDRLVPYVVAGVGALVAQVNDGDGAIALDGGGLTRARPTGIFGVGIEYFVLDNVALGIEGRYFLSGSQSYEAHGESRKIDLNSGYASFGFRALYPEHEPAKQAEAARRAFSRFYVSVRGGGALLIHPQPFPQVTMDAEQDVFGSDFTLMYGAAVGAQLGRHVSVAASISNWEYHMSVDGYGRVGEYALWPILVETKLLMPGILPEPFEPYLIAGVGVELAEANDGVLHLAIDAKDVAPIGTFGAGLEYHLGSNLAIGLGARYQASRGHTLRVGDGPELSGNFDSFVLSLEVRAVFAQI